MSRDSVGWLSTICVICVFRLLHFHTHAGMLPLVPVPVPVPVPISTLYLRSHTITIIHFFVVFCFVLFFW
jgi:hypothetical protein